MATETSDLTGVKKTVQLYFDGLHKSDISLLKQAFHPASTISGYGGDGTLTILSLDQFLSFVETIPSPEANGVEYDMEILSVDQTGNTAAIKVRDFYMGCDFTDYLHLIEIGNEWLIVGKVFHFDPRE